MATAKDAAYHLTHDEVVGGSMEGFKFDIDICKQAFDYYDTNKSGTLDSGELMRLAEVLWDTFYPNGPKIDAQTKAFMVDDIMQSSDNNSDRLISFDEFLPWYRRMAEKHWRATHGGKTIVKEERPAPAPVPTPAPAPARTKLAAAAPPAAKPSAPKLPSPPKASLPSGCSVHARQSSIAQASEARGSLLLMSKSCQMMQHRDVRHMID